MAPIHPFDLEILELLGAGGVGEVHRVRDRRTGEVFARKALTSPNRSWLPGFKQEFRSLANVRHPNLVVYHALWEEDGLWCLLMDLVEGEDLSRWLRARRADRPSPTPTTAPRTPSGGRFADAEPAPAPPHGPGSAGSDTIGFDFDLAGAPDPQGAPNQAAADPPTNEAATFDLSQAIVPVPAPAAPARTPPACDVARLLAVLPGILDALEALHAAGLVHRDIKPANVRVRPDGQPVLLDFGLATPVDGAHHAVAGTPRYMAPESLDGRVGPAADRYSLGATLYHLLVGLPPHPGKGTAVLMAKRSRPATPVADRVAGLPVALTDAIDALLAIDPAARPAFAALRAQLGLSDAGVGASALPFVGRAAELTHLRGALKHAGAGPRWVSVRGPSGMGKSSLLRELGRQVSGGDHLVLTGCCHAMEQLPYKALDAVIDALRLRLERTPGARASVDGALRVLGGAFPAIGPSDAGQPGAAALGAALGDVLQALQGAGPSLLVIDDAQWGDVDSARVLLALRRLRPALPVLLCVTARTDTPPGPFLDAMEAAWTPDDALALQPLDPADVAAAAQAHGLPDAALSGLVAAGRTSTYLLAELISDGGSAADLGDLIRARLARLDPASRRVAQVVALGVGPLPLELLQAVWQRLDPGLPVVRALGEARAARVLHLAPSGDGLRVGPYHSQVRAALVQGLAAEDAAPLHHALAERWSEAAPDEHARIAHHWVGAGRPQQARSALLAAADQADRAGAWGLQAGLLAQIVALTDGAAQAEQMRRASALERSGQRSQAGRLLLELAPTLDPPAARRARILAGEHLLRSGQVEAGLDVLRDLATRAGLPWSGNRWVTVVRIVIERVRLAIRGYGPRPRDPARERADRLAQVDLLAALNRSLRLNAPFHGMFFGSRFVRVALDLGEPGRLAAALALEAGTLAVKGSDRPASADAVAGQVAALAEGLADPRAQMSAWYNLAVANYMQGDFEAAWAWQQRGDAASDRLGEEAAAEADLREASPGTIGWYRGNWAAVAARADAGLADAHDRGDRWMATWLVLGYHAMARGVTGGDLDRLLAQVDAAVAAWPQGLYSVQHFSGLVAAAELCLLRGEPERGRARYAADGPRLKAEMLDQAQFSRAVIYDQQARLAAAAGDAVAARAHLDRLDREGAPWIAVVAGLTRAALDPDPAALARVAQQATELGMTAHADVALELLEGRPRPRPGIDRSRRFLLLAPGRSDPWPPPSTPAPSTGSSSPTSPTPD